MACWAIIGGMDEDWNRVAEYVRTRRTELRLTQDDVQDRGGPSAAKLREIENKRSQTLSASKRRDLERAIEWTDGSFDSVLRGGEPSVKRLDSGAERSTERQEVGAWSLGPQLMVELSLAATDVSGLAVDVQSFSEDDDIDQILFAAEGLAVAAEDLAERALTVAKLGVGGPTRLAEHRRRTREARSRAREAKERARARGSASNANADLPIAARTTSSASKGERFRDALDAAGEESQDSGDE